MCNSMKISKTIYVEVVGLGEKIRSLREKDSRPLTEICHEISLSTNQWYRIEKELDVLPYETLQKIENALGADFKVKIK